MYYLHYLHELHGEQAVLCSCTFVLFVVEMGFSLRLCVKLSYLSF